MRRLSAIRFILLVILVLSADATYAQLPGWQEQMLATDDKWYQTVLAMAHRVRAKHFHIDRDVVVLVDQLGRVQEVDLTQPSGRDLDYEFESTGLEVGSSAGWRLSDQIRAVLGATVDIGNAGLAYTNPQQVVTAFDSTAGVLGFSIDGGVTWTFATGQHIWSAIGGFDYHFVDADDVRRTGQNPAGGRITAEQNKIRGFTNKVTAAIAWSLQRSIRTTLSGGGGYVSTDMSLRRQLTVESTSAPGVSTHATQRTDVSKQGPFGTARAAVAFDRGVTMFVEVNVGAQSGVSAGASLTFK